MDVTTVDRRAALIASAIAVPSRARMLYSLSDGRARTSTELAILADITPSTASVHLKRLESQHLVKVLKQGKQRYYALDGIPVAAALEALSVLSGTRQEFVPTTPHPLRAARSCYDHLAGTLGVALHDRLLELGWLASRPTADAYQLSSSGSAALRGLGLDLEALQSVRRRYAYPCLDWSERRPHLGGALGAALMEMVLKRKWVTREPDSRALRITPSGRRQLLERFGLNFPKPTELL
jgi:DNA-binding transcriptional ArsR family regulator